MTQNLIGTEVWDCDGCPLTPRMRRDILLVAAEMYEDWEANGTSFQWDRMAGALVETEPNPALTISEFLCELTGERHPLRRWDLLDHSEELFEWLKDYLHETWRDAVAGEGGEDGDESDEDEDLDPFWEAQGRVHEWLAPLLIVDVLAWRAKREEAQADTADWHANGF